MSLVTAMLLLTMIPAQAADIAKPTTSTTVSTNEVESAEVKAMISRIDEIRAMDKSAMSSSEKKELRKEMRQMKNTVNHSHGSTVYISGGLIVLIVVLIILL